MLKYLIVLLLPSSLLIAESFDFQKVYEVPELSASTIEQAFGEKKFNVEATTMDKISSAFDLLSGEKTEKEEGKIQCNIAAEGWPKVMGYFDGDIILETKDGRYRLTISNMISNDGYPLSEMAPHAQKSCKKDLDNWAENKFQQVKSFDSDW